MHKIRVHKLVNLYELGTNDDSERFQSPNSEGTILRDTHVLIFAFYLSLRSVSPR